MTQTLSIVRKELNAYFGSLMALIFVGVFLAATLATGRNSSMLTPQGTMPIFSGGAP